VINENNKNNREPADNNLNLLPPVNRENMFVVLMKHRPEPEPMLDQQRKHAPVLQVSGHTHNGQIFPFNFLVRLQHRWPTGQLHQLSEENFFYISPGTGTWGPPFRLLARPEVTMITLQHQTN